MAEKKAPVEINQRDVELYQATSADNSFGIYYIAYFDKNFIERRFSVPQNMDLIEITLKELYNELKKDDIDIRDILNIKPSIINGFNYNKLPENIFTRIKEKFSKLKERSLEEKVL